MEGSKLVVKSDIETSKLVDAHLDFQKHQERLFSAFPSLAQHDRKTYSTKKELYPGQHEDEQVQQPTIDILPLVANYTRRLNESYEKWRATFAN